MRRGRRSVSPRRRSRSRDRSSRGSGRRSGSQLRSAYRSMTRSRSRSREMYRRSRSRKSVSSSSGSSRSVSPRSGKNKKNDSSGWLESGYGRMTPPPAPSLSSSPPPAPSISSNAPPGPQAPNVIDAGPPPALPFSQPIPSLGSQAISIPPFGNDYQGNYSNFSSSTFYRDTDEPFGFADPNNIKVQGPPGYGPPSSIPMNLPPTNWVNQPTNYSSDNFPPPSTENPPPSGFNTLPQHPAGAGKPNAVEQESIQQKSTLVAQREEFFTKRIALTRELASLREQKSLLQKSGSTGAEKILRENSKLQDEILQKLKSMDSVIEMFTHMIGDKDKIADLLTGTSFNAESPTPAPMKQKKRSRSRSRSRSKSKKEKKKKEKKPKKKRSLTPQEAKINVIHYDPELHWCSTCNVFPRSAVAYLTHLHSDEHKNAVNTMKHKDKTAEESMPWRAHQPKEQSPPVYKDAPSKRVPIRGVPFLSAATAWYCSLCKIWLGDMDVVNHHLRGKIHSKSYTEFVTQNPHWEVDWLRDRTRAYERKSETKSAKLEEESKAAKGETAEDVNELKDRLKELIDEAKNRDKRRQKSNSSRSSSSSSSDSDASSDSGSDRSAQRGRKKNVSKKKTQDTKTKKDTSDKRKFEEIKHDRKSRQEKFEPSKKRSPSAKRRRSRVRSFSRSRSRSPSIDRGSGFKGQHDWDRVRGTGFRGVRGRGGRPRIRFGNRKWRAGQPSLGFYGPAEPPSKVNKN